MSAGHSAAALDFLSHQRQRLLRSPKKFSKSRQNELLAAGPAPFAQIFR